jgi:hypothetical protein
MAGAVEVPVGVPDACTLPTAEQPLRLVEFDALFRASLRAVERVGPTHLRLRFDGGAEPAVRDLAARESACCSFFEFGIRSQADEVVVDVRVPASRALTLVALGGWAASAAGRAGT